MLPSAHRLDVQSACRNQPGVQREEEGLLLTAANHFHHSHPTSPTTTRLHHRQGRGRFGNRNLSRASKRSWKTGKDSEQECGALTLRQDSAGTAGNTYLTTERRNVVLHEMAKSKQTPNTLTYTVCVCVCACVQPMQRNKTSAASQDVEFPS